MRKQPKCSNPKRATPSIDQQEERRSSTAALVRRHAVLLAGQRKKNKRLKIRQKVGLNKNKHPDKIKTDSKLLMSPSSLSLAVSLSSSSESQQHQYHSDKNVSEVMERINSSKSLQTTKRKKKVSFTPPTLSHPRATKSSWLSCSSSSSTTTDGSSLSSSYFSESFSNCCVADKESVISDLTWMDKYSCSQYYREQHLLFLWEKQNRIINTFLDCNVCLYFCQDPPVYNIEFVEK